MDETARIPLEEFEDFATCRLSGQQFGQRYEFYCEAFAASLADKQQRQARAPAPRQLTIARRGREPRDTIDLQQHFDEYCFPPMPWGGRIG